MHVNTLIIWEEAGGADVRWGSAALVHQSDPDSVFGVCVVFLRAAAAFWPSFPAPIDWAVSSAAVGGPCTRTHTHTHTHANTHAHMQTHSNAFLSFVKFSFNVFRYRDCREFYLIDLIIIQVRATVFKRLIWKLLMFESSYFIQNISKCVSIRKVLTQKTPSGCVHTAHLKFWFVWLTVHILYTARCML